MQDRKGMCYEQQSLVSLTGHKLTHRSCQLRQSLDPGFWQAVLQDLGKEFGLYAWRTSQQSLVCAGLQQAERLDVKQTAQELIAGVSKAALERFKGPMETWSAQYETLPPPPKRSR